ncbi:MAG TPA: hypothetical protein VK681_29760, partial [Reyranella sp.]|nr:hypothetical protein [Reyranella sp.]
MHAAERGVVGTARRLPGPQSRLPRWQYGNGGPVYQAAMAQSAPSARSPRVRDLDHGRVAALLTALQFGYWAVVVYLPLFLSAAIHISMEGAGAALLAATLPML